MASGGISDADLNQLEEIILSKIQQRTPPRMNEDTYIVKAFRYHDLSNEGWCEFDQFVKTLLPFTAGISDQDLHSIFARYAPDGQLHYKTFAIDFVSGARRLQGLAQDGGEDDSETVEETLMRIKMFLYSQGPRGIIRFATVFRDADPQNLRALSYDTFAAVMAEFFAGTPCHLQDESIETLFHVFRQPYAPGQIAYDEFFLALKEEPTPERRACIRSAFRRLDSHSESLVDVNHMIQSFNASRHPQVSDGTRTMEDVLSEFSETLQELVAFRRGQRSYPTNLVAWEEFEDYYKFINGCYEVDSQFCAMLTRIWDLDKGSQTGIETKAAVPGPAAGLPPKSRAGLHHWQTNTLPRHHFSLATIKNVDSIFQRARSQIAKKGLRWAIDVVVFFYSADDDVDDLVDTHEFRRACKQSNLSFRDVEEKTIFQVCGSGVPGSKDAKLNVPQFLQQLHGEISPARRAVVEQVFASLGGDPSSEDSVVTPAVLKDNFACENHPMVTKGHREPDAMLAEFLDTFSLLAHVQGGCQNGVVSFADFLAYYEVVSSTVDNDAYFNLTLRRLWGLPGGGGDRQNGAPRPSSPRGMGSSLVRGGGYPTSPNRESPMAEPRPPAHSGPSAYATASGGDQQHRRFLRKEVPGTGAPDGAGPQQSPVSGFSPITKSSIVFTEADTSELNTVIGRLRESIAKRGLRGWKSLVDKFTSCDNRKNGGIMRMDFDRVLKTLGFGLAPEERDALYKGLSAGRKDGAMDYKLCLSKLKGRLSEKRQAAVDELLDSLQDSNSIVWRDELKERFEAMNSPAVMLGQKNPKQASQDFNDAVDMFGGFDGDLSCEAFNEFFLIVSAVHPTDEEFHLMTTAAFGLPH